MFSFHKPKIYRSNLGCCICKAKSSSSRFTDSKKYENEFERCFRIQEKRSGEICNACVLLVKRWKKLSPENRSIKHWHHVVDARAGPGTKLTIGRRLTSSSHNTHNSNSSSNSSASAEHHHHNNQSNSLSESSSSSSTTSEPAMNSPPTNNSNTTTNQVLPLSSNQITNQSSSCSASGAGATTNMSIGANNNRQSSSNSTVTRKAVCGFNNAKYSDFTTSFTTSRRSYMTPESFSINSSSSSSLTKPQSSLNSSAFESVIKRFRQRQQQELLEAQRRQLSRLERRANSTGKQAQAKLLKTTTTTKLPTSKTSNELQLPTSNSVTSSDSNNEVDLTDKSDKVKERPTAQQQQQQPSKRFKRSSESICVDGLKVSSLLDSSIWRKEKICCGYIFRGLYNEVAIFPKLLKPCQCKQLEATSTNDKEQEEEQEQLTTNDSQHNNNNNKTNDNNNHQHHVQRKRKTSNIKDVELLTRQRLKTNSPSPPPRAMKSGSISSCDSNTSGTGSMEEPLDELCSTTSGGSVVNSSIKEDNSTSNATSNDYQEENALNFIYI